MTKQQLDAIDRGIVNSLQGGFPVCETPFAEAALRLALSEDELILRLQSLLERGAISRFGPLYNAERLGGAVTLAAMQVPQERFEEVAALVNAYPAVAHNYEREHELNMWFVISVQTPAEIAAVINRIESETGLEVLNMPKRDEFFVGLRIEV